jgi:hypothetical protein
MSFQVAPTDTAFSFCASGDTSDDSIISVRRVQAAANQVDVSCDQGGERPGLYVLSLLISSKHRLATHYLQLLYCQSIIPSHVIARRLPMVHPFFT